MVAKKSTKKRSTRSSAATTVKKTSRTRSKKQAAMRSFKIYPNPKPFAVFRITRQTAYWTLLLVFIIIMQLWILRIQLDIAALTDQLLAQ